MRRRGPAVGNWMIERKNDVTFCENVHVLDSEKFYKFSKSD